MNARIALAALVTLGCGDDTTSPWDVGPNDVSAVRDAGTYDWSSAGELVAPRVVADMLVRTDGEVILTGCCDGSLADDTNTVFFWDGAWTARMFAGGNGNVFHPASSATGILSDGSVLIAGGASAGSATLGYAPPFTADVVSISPTGEETPRATLPNPRGGAASIILPSGEMLIVAGYERDETSRIRSVDTALVYRPDSDSWVSAGSIAEGVVHMRVVLAGGAAYVLGGQTFTLATEQPRFVNTVQRWSGGTAWETVAPMSEGRAGMIAAYLPRSNRILVAGGRTSLADVSMQTELFDIETGTLKPVHGARDRTCPSQRPSAATRRLPTAMC